MQNYTEDVRIFLVAIIVFTFKVKISFSRMRKQVPAGMQMQFSHWSGTLTLGYPGSVWEIQVRMRMELTKSTLVYGMWTLAHHTAGSQWKHWRLLFMDFSRNSAFTWLLIPLGCNSLGHKCCSSGLHQKAACRWRLSRHFRSLIINTSLYLFIN